MSQFNQINDALFNYRFEQPPQDVPFMETTPNYNYPYFSHSPTPNVGNNYFPPQDFLANTFPTVQKFVYSTPNQAYTHQFPFDNRRVSVESTQQDEYYMAPQFGDNNNPEAAQGPIPETPKTAFTDPLALFARYQHQLQTSARVRLLRTNTLPKSENTKYFVTPNSKSTFYLNYDYPTVCIKQLKLISSVGNDWTDFEKFGQQRRLVLFYWEFTLRKPLHDETGKQVEFLEGQLELNYEVILQKDYKMLFEGDGDESPKTERIKYLESILSKHKSFCIISCLYWYATDKCYLTSVDLLFLLDKLSGRSSNFTNQLCITNKGGRYQPKTSTKSAKETDFKEINRIRRNLLNFKLITLGKMDEPEDQDQLDFFQTIIRFENPKPRKIEKKLKVYEWSILGKALEKIMKKYSLDLK